MNDTVYVDTQQEGEELILEAFQNTMKGFNVSATYFPDPFTETSRFYAALKACERYEGDRNQFFQLLISTFYENIRRRIIGPKYGILKRPHIYIMTDTFVNSIWKKHIGILTEDCDVSAKTVIAQRNRKYYLATIKPREEAKKRKRTSVV